MGVWNRLRSLEPGIDAVGAEPPLAYLILRFQIGGGGGLLADASLAEAVGFDFISVHLSAPCCGNKVSSF